MEKINNFKILKKELVFLEKLLLVLSMWKLALGYGRYHMHQIQLWVGGAPRAFMSHHAKCGAQHFVVRANP
jgi:hypothetical protein